MAAYGLACAQAEAITLNPDVRANAARDADLASLRDSGQLDRILAV
jgi:hypothetical protein